MDPLSATASLIAVIGAAKKIKKLLDLLKAVRGAPQGLSDLLSEVSRLEQVLQAIFNALDDSQEPLRQLGDVLDEARSKLLELDSLIQYTLTKVSGSTKVDRWQWLRKGGDVDTLRRQLHVVRQDLIVLISTKNLMTSQQVAITAERFSSQQQQTDHLIGQISARHEAMFAILCDKLEETPKTLKSLTRMMGNSRKANIEISNTLATTHLENTKNLHRPIDTKSRIASPNELRLQTIQRIDKSQKLCHCSCHRYRQAAIPGVLTLGTRNLPHPYSCNIDTCNCRAAPYMRIKYHVPTWVAYRMISIWFNGSPLHGPELLLRIPRVVPDSSPIIESVKQGDLIQFKRLIAEGHGSPYDIDEDGYSFLATILCYGVSTSRLEFAAYLIDIGVDWVDSLTESSAAVYFEGCAAGFRFDKFKSHLRFLTTADWDDVCEEMGFCELHKIVCGFSIRDLDAEARLHPAILDELDARGLTPLYYASLLGRADCVHDLLECGSNPNVGKKMPLFAAARSEDHQCIKFLLQHGATTECLNGESLWAIRRGLYRHAKEEDALAIDALLLEHEFDFNCADDDGRTALMYCSEFPRERQSWLQNHRMPKLRQLLETPVNTEMIDDEGRTALHYSIEHSNVMAFDMLINAGARPDVDTLGGSSILHYAILHIRDVKFVQAMRKADLSSVNLEQLDDDGYTALDLLVLRAGAEWNDHPYQFRLFDGYERCVRPYRSSYTPWLYRWIGVAVSSEEEGKVIEALEDLYRWIQGLQGVQEKEKCPPLQILVECSESFEDTSDGPVGCTRRLPCAWPEKDDS